MKAMMIAKFWHAVDPNGFIAYSLAFARPSADRIDLARAIGFPMRMRVYGGDTHKIEFSATAQSAGELFTMLAHIERLCPRGI